MALATELLAALPCLNPGKTNQPNPHMKKIVSVCATVLMVSATLHAQYWTTPAPVTLPGIPSHTFNITSYGASTGSGNNATAIQNTVNAAAAAGGGTVQVPSGTFLSGPFHLTNKINLNLASGATLKMLPYGQWPGTTVFITAQKCSDVEISGSGTIDGQGAAWWAAFANNPSLARPQEVSIGSSTRVEITGIHLQNSPEEHIWVKYDTNVTVSGITINTTASNAKNTDGVDITAQHAYFVNDTLNCGDDNIAMSGKYIDIENCAFGVGHGCSIGSITQNGVSFVTVHGCTFNGTTSGIRLKSERGRGGTVQYLAYNNNTMTSVPNPVWISSWYPSDPGNPTSVTVSNVTSTTPIWKHIKIQNLTATGSSNGGTIYGLPEEHVSDVTFDNVHISATTGMKIYYANSIIFTNGSNISVSSGYPVTIYNASVSGIGTHNYP
ncbi:MAG TPA: glycosyl hydrolase family 28 protein [Verrucomicrobiae bacterium]|nr:glycosyl hydrolase family 28 protein [Verrucomicrobiae bacterium]